MAAKNKTDTKESKVSPVQTRTGEVLVLNGKNFSQVQIRDAPRLICDDGQTGSRQRLLNDS